ncbi:hypothetical protein HHK36_018121 [Tetracentron sinense]|uniref:Tify domain-containing protein n=1 Tax=Tetracentron sinense TaxID=13715 RepID=A0A835DA15_TETSI|nr:hypothetical protein HHK36_018121 [Tetracentron sinense]
MANGTDSEEVVLALPVRTGLKREFAFALKVQSEVCGSLGRTRARKLQNSISVNGVSEISSNKRFKSSNAEEQEKDVVELSIEKDPKNDLVKSLSGEGSKSDLAKPKSKEEPKRDSVESPNKELKKDLVKLKRELAFALKVQSEFSGSFGRTRSGKFQNSISVNGVLENLSNKRIRSSKSKEQKNDILEPSIDGEPKNDVVKFLSGEEPKSDLVKLTREEEPENDPAKSPIQKDVMVKAPSEEGTGVETPIVIDGSSEVENALPEKPKPPRRLTRSALKLKLEAVEISATSANSVVREDAKKEAIIKGDGKVSYVETPVVIDDSRKVNNALPEKPMRQLSRTALKPKLDAVEILATRGNSVVYKDGKNKAIIEAEGKTSNGEKTPVVIDDSNEVQDALPVKSPRRFTRSTLKPKEDLVKISATSSNSVVSDYNKNEAIIKADGKTSNVETPIAIDDSTKVHNALPEKPLRRFTRSALKPKVEQVEISPELSGSSVVSEDAKNEPITEGKGKTTNVVGTLRTPRKNTLEMKMSKKIALTKFPSKLKELLETGMLEGLPVKYVWGKNVHLTKTRSLRGTIKDGGILCSCNLCRGNKVVTPFQFEHHAGSLNKHPAKYMYLENGNSLRVVLNACKDTPLDTLEATIQSAIGSSPVKNAICQDCKGSFPSSRAGCSLPLCNSCMESKESQASAARTAGTSPRYALFHSYFQLWRFFHLCSGD